jgi:hypothetical protein
MQTMEHRQSARVRSFLRGEIIHSNGSSRTECTIRDLSDGGARIEAPPSVTVPEFFDLLIPQKGVKQRARIVWRHGLDLGLTFAMETSAHAPVEGPMDVKIRMLELESEVARLRTQLMEMKSVIATFVETKQSA